MPPPSPGGLDTGGLDTDAGPTRLLLPDDLRHFFAEACGPTAPRFRSPCCSPPARPTGGPDVALRRDFTGVEINRIGDHRPFYSDYEDVALLDALIPTAFDIDPFSGAHRPARARYTSLRGLRLTWGIPKGAKL